MRRRAERRRARAGDASPTALAPATPVDPTTIGAFAAKVSEIDKHAWSLNDRRRKQTRQTQMVHTNEPDRSCASSAHTNRTTLITLSLGKPDDHDCYRGN